MHLVNPPQRLDNLVNDISLLRTLEDDGNTTYPDGEAGVEEGGGDEAKKRFGFAILGLILILSLVVLWRLWVCVTRWRERNILMQESIRAENVLGDMAMVPSADSEDEDDNEFI